MRRKILHFFLKNFLFNCSIGIIKLYNNASKSCTHNFEVKIFFNMIEFLLKL